MNRQFNQQRKAAMGVEDFEDGRPLLLASSMLLSLNQNNNPKNNEMNSAKEETMTPPTKGTNLEPAWGCAASASTKPNKLGLLAIQRQEETEKQKSEERQKEQARRRKNAPAGRRGWGNQLAIRGVERWTPNHSNTGTEENRTVRVVGLSQTTTETDLSELCRDFGRVSRIHIVKDRETKQSRGFAFVTFASHPEAALAVEGLSGKRYDYRILQAQWAHPRNLNDTPQSQFKYRSGYGKALPQTRWRSKEKQMDK